MADKNTIQQDAPHMPSHTDDQGTGSGAGPHDQQGDGQKKTPVKPKVQVLVNTRVTVDGVVRKFKPGIIEKPSQRLIETAIKMPGNFKVFGDLKNG